MRCGRARALSATTVAWGLLLLTVIAPVGAAEAQVYFVQGERGPAGASALSCDGTTCTLDRDLEVAGRVTGGELEVLTSHRASECPEGYVQDETETDFVLCVDGLDEMVRVGDIWVDRYEASVWESADCTGTQYGDTDDWADVAATFPASGQFSAPLYACSISGEAPAGWVNYFLAQAACAASGKRLLTNAEWQIAVTGTVDPGGSGGGGGECVTSGSLRAAGGGSACSSVWGVEDMIGNVEEYVADWYQAGRQWQTTDGEMLTPWPSGYGANDTTYNLNGRAYMAGYRSGLPAAALRGGARNHSDACGAFRSAVNHAPPERNYVTGFRCARSR